MHIWTNRPLSVHPWTNWPLSVLLKHRFLFQTFKGALRSPPWPLRSAPFLQVHKSARKCTHMDKSASKCALLHRLTSKCAPLHKLPPWKCQLSWTLLRAIKFFLSPSLPHSCSFRCPEFSFSLFSRFFHHLPRYFAKIISCLFLLLHLVSYVTFSQFSFSSCWILLYLYLYKYFISYNPWYIYVSFEFPVQIVQICVSCYSCSFYRVTPVLTAMGFLCNFDVSRETMEGDMVIVPLPASRIFFFVA